MNILHKDLHVTPYHIHIGHQLVPADMAKRREMCSWFEEKFEEDENFLENVWFSDEAHFQLSGHVNSKNNIYWGNSKPDEVLQQPLHSEKCTVWAAMSRHCIIGPFFFEDGQGRTTTVDTDGYIEVLGKFWQALGRRELDRDSQWFMQDGAAPHCSTRTLAWLRQRFRDFIISRRCDVEWAPHSLDLNRLNFHLVWGYLKGHFKERSPITLI